MVPVEGIFALICVGSSAHGKRFLTSAVTAALQGYSLHCIDQCILGTFGRSLCRNENPLDKGAVFD